MRAPTILMLLAVYLAGCAGMRSGDTISDSARPPSLTILVTNARATEIEPCGCTARQLGGVVREANALAQWSDISKNRLSVTMGKTFVPDTAEEFSKNGALFDTKALYVAEAMKLLKVDLVSPSYADLSFGIKALEKFRSKGGFRYISANLYPVEGKKPLFDRYATFKYNGKKVLVTGISWRTQEGYPAKVRVESPLESLREVFKEVPDANLIVVLSDLPAEKREELMDELPQINVMLGGNNPLPNYRAVQYTGKSVYFDVMTKARALARVDVNLDGKSAEFYNADMAEHIKKEREWREKEIAKAKKSKAKGAVATSVDFQQQYLRRTKDIPLKTEPGLTGFSSKLTELLTELDKPENDLSKLITRYKAAIRDLAVNAD